MLWPGGGFRCLAKRRRAASTGHRLHLRNDTPRTSPSLVAGRCSGYAGLQPDSSPAPFFSTTGGHATRSVPHDQRERLLRARPRPEQRRENGCLSTGDLPCSHTRHNLSHRALSPLLMTMAKRCRLLKRASRVGLWSGRLPAAWWFWWQRSRLASLRLRRNACTVV